MRTITFATLAAGLSLLSAPVFADDAHHPEQAAGKTPPAAAAKADAKTLKAMQGNVDKMRKQLDRAAQAKSGAERDKVLAENMQSMQENMRMMSGMMMDCPMMGSGGMGMMGSQPGGGADERMQRMEQRMETMQSMMERMMKERGAGDMPAGTDKP